ncbi:MAG TPA: FkbM family methyltransferase [Thermoplasmata archaeon]|nr:FkbM family methyltransferase [Thermoplasmata archaeon]
MTSTFTDIVGALLNRPKEARGRSLISLALYPSTSSGPAAQWAAVRVPVRSLDALGDRSLPGVIDWLLIDTEGGEAGVLRGAPKMLARTRRVVVEVTQGGGAAEVDRILRSAGFSLRERAPQTPRTEYRFFERSEPLP